MSRDGPGSSVAPRPFFLRFLFLGEPRGRRGQGLWRGASQVPLWPDRHPIPSARFTHGGGVAPASTGRRKHGSLGSCGPGVGNERAAGPWGRGSPHCPQTWLPGIVAPLPQAPGCQLAA